MIEFAICIKSVELLNDMEKIAIAVLVFLLTYLFSTYLYEIEKVELIDTNKQLQLVNQSLKKEIDSLEGEFYQCEGELNKFQMSLYYLADEYPEAARKYDKLVYKN